MRSGSLSMSTRRAFFAVITVALLCGASGMRAQEAAGQQPAPAQTDPFLVSGDNVLFLFQVDPAKTADWESAWTSAKTILSALADKPEYKALGESIHMFKAATAGSASPAQPVIYVLHLNPPVKMSYDPAKFLFAPGVMERKQADEIYAKIAAAFKGVNVLPLTKIGA